MAGHLRASQSRSAIPRMLTSQQYSLPELQITACRWLTLVAGIAMMPAKRLKRVMNGVFIFGRWVTEKQKSIEISLKVILVDYV